MNYIKKFSAVLAILIIIAVSAAFTSCTQNKSSEEISESSSAVSSSEEEETTERITSTTSPVSSNEEKGAALEKAVKSALGDNFEVSGETQSGSFKAKSQTDAAELYKNEASDEYEKEAKKNAEAFVEKISDNYPDEITYASCSIEEIGTGENGIDSAVYLITYINTQNQELTLQANSSGNIYYVSCNFTW